MVCSATSATQINQPATTNMYASPHMLLAEGRHINQRVVETGFLRSEAQQVALDGFFVAGLLFEDGLRNLHWWYFGSIYGGLEGLLHVKVRFRDSKSQ